MQRPKPFASGFPSDQFRAQSSQVQQIVPHSQKIENFYRLGIFTGWAPEKKEGAND